MAEAFRVHVINPRKKTKGKAKSAPRRKKRGHKKTAAKAAKRPTAAKKKEVKQVAKRKRRVKRGVAKSGTPRRIVRRKRRKNPIARIGTRRAARTRNPIGLGGVTNELKSGIPRMIGKLATAWAVMRVSNSPMMSGGHSGLFGTPQASVMMGQSWGWQQYAIAMAVAAWAPKFIGKWVNPTEFRRGATDLILEKLIWTEGIARSPWAVKAFGANPGMVAVGPGNQAYWGSGGQWNAMQGLVASSPLDGLVDASPMDGPESYNYGHLLPASATAAERKSGAYTGSGYADPFHAAFA